MAVKAFKAALAQSKATAVLVNGEERVQWIPIKGVPEAEGWEIIWQAIEHRASPVPSNAFILQDPSGRTTTTNKVSDALNHFVDLILSGEADRLFWG